MKIIVGHTKLSKEKKKEYETIISGYKTVETCKQALSTIIRNEDTIDCFDEIEHMILKRWNKLNNTGENK